MHACPECGLDVAEPGLCNECTEKRQRRQASAIVTDAWRPKGAANRRGQVPAGAAPPRNRRAAAWWTAGTIVAAGAILLVVLIGGSPAAATLPPADGSVAANGDGANAAADAESGPVPAADAGADDAGPADAGPTDTAAAGASASEPAFDVRSRTEQPPITNEDEYVAWMLARTDETEQYLRQRWRRAQVALGWREFDLAGAPGRQLNERLLHAFLRSPRELFARPANRNSVYDHSWLPIGYGVTISGPHMVTKMTQTIDPAPDHRVLEIGTGSGYQAAVLSNLSNHVYTIEIIAPLAAETAAIYELLRPTYAEYRNISTKAADGYFGWEEAGPFDRIIVTAGIDHIPPPLLQQLAPDGIMVIPVGPPGSQTLLRVTKRVAADGTVTLQREDVYEGRRKVTFVPFTASDGGVHSQSGGD